MNRSSEKRLQRLHPALASAVRDAIAELAVRGISVEVVQGLRTFEEQDALYAKGRTEPGPIVTQARGGESNHNFGLAADLCPFAGGKPDWSAPIDVWAAIGKTAIAHGLEWGGQWKKFVDKPHVQLPSMTVEECATCYQSGGLDAVWEIATERIGWTGGAGETAPRRASHRRPMRAGVRSIAPGTGAGVSEKRVTVILYGSDRNLWRGGPLQVRVTDLFAAGGPDVVWQGTTHESTVELKLQLPFDAGQVYGLTFSASKHRPAWHIVRRADFIRTREQIEIDDVILRLMLVPDAADPVDMASALGRLQQIASPFAAPATGVDAATFDPLDVAAKMAFLNIEAKLRETTIDSAPLMSFVRAVRHVAVDRVFVLFDAELTARMPRAIDFAGAPGHPAPHGVAGLPAHPDSWKHTRFAEGNVQLSFAADPEPFPAGSTSQVHSADVDIDLGRGLAHAREWLVNNVFLPGHKTNQALVYALLFAQNILPVYALNPIGQIARSISRSLNVRAAAPATPRAARRPPRRRSATRRKK
jgi:hypothetical protein